VFLYANDISGTLSWGPTATPTLPRSRQHASLKMSLHAYPQTIFAAHGMGAGPGYCRSPCYTHQNQSAATRARGCPKQNPRSIVDPLSPHAAGKRNTHKLLIIHICICDHGEHMGLFTSPSLDICRDSQADSARAPVLADSCVFMTLATICMRPAGADLLQDAWPYSHPSSSRPYLLLPALVAICAGHMTH